MPRSSTAQRCYLSPVLRRHRHLLACDRGHLGSPVKRASTISPGDVRGTCGGRPIRKDTATKIISVGSTVEDGAGCAVEEVKPGDEPVDGLDVSGEKRLILREVPGRH